MPRRTGRRAAPDHRARLLPRPHPFGARIPPSPPAGHGEDARSPRPHAATRMPGPPGSPRVRLSRDAAEALAAEYVLGTLRGPARARFASLAARDARVAEAMRR